MCYSDGCPIGGFQIGRGDDNCFLLSWQQINEVVAVAGSLHGDLHKTSFASPLLERVTLYSPSLYCTLLFTFVSGSSNIFGQ